MLVQRLVGQAESALWQRQQRNYKYKNEFIAIEKVAFSTRKIKSNYLILNGQGEPPVWPANPD